MKPDSGMAGSMEEEPAIDANSLFVDIGMLILEARIPDDSPKGRQEGPHCPTLHTELKHGCKPQEKLCKRAQFLKEEMSFLWKNEIPLCIEVVMYPECHHGRRATERDMPSGGGEESYLLLERWMIQIVPRKSSQPHVANWSLFQAIRSYLYFSQISSWLSATKGTQPKYWTLGIVPPGETNINRFSQPPDNHNFPMLHISRNTSIRVSVSTRPRSPEIPKVVCGLLCDRELCRKNSETDSSENEYAWPPSCRGNWRRNISEKSRKYEETTSKTPSCDQTRHQIGPHMHDSTMQKPRRKSPESDRVKNAGAIPKQNIADCKQEMFLPLNSAGAAIPQQKPAYKTLTSPMVLMTEQIGMQLYFGRESYGGPALPRRDSKKSSVPCGELSPSEIERYLSSLRQQKPHKSESPDSLSPSSIESSSSVVMSPKLSALSKDLRKDTHLATSNEIVETYSKMPPSGTKTSPSYERTCLIGKMDPVLRSDYSPCRNEVKKILDYPDCDSDYELCRARSVSRSNSPRITSYSSSSSTDSVQTVVNTSDTKRKSPKVQPGNTIEDVEELQFALQASKLSETSTDSDRPKFYIGETDDDELHDGKSHNGVNVIENTSEIVIHENYAKRDTASAETNGNSSSQSNCSHIASLEKPELGENGVYKIRNRVVEKASDAVRSESKDVLPPEPVPKGFKKSTSLLQSFMKEKASQENVPNSKSVPIPTEKEKSQFHRNYTASASMLFNYSTGLPLQSSPAPIKKNHTHAFGFDDSLMNPRAIKNAISCYTLDSSENDGRQDEVPVNNKLSRSAPASTNSLLGNFEESLLNGRIDPVGIVDGFTSEIGASGSFCPKHVHLPVTAYFFKLSDDNAPSPYLGHMNLESLGKKGYHVPKKGTVQVTLFNPSKTVVKMFVVMYDLSDMPANCQTFLRQRTLYMPVADCRNDHDAEELPAYLRYLIHLRFKSSKTGRIYLHTDIRVIFARDKFEFDPRVATYELRSFTEGPSNPKFSPIK